MDSSDCASEMSGGGGSIRDARGRSIQEMRLREEEEKRERTECVRHIEHVVVSKAAEAAEMK